MGLGAGASGSWDVTIAGRTTKQTRKDRATQPMDHGRLRWAIGLACNYTMERITICRQKSNLVWFFSGARMTSVGILGSTSICYNSLFSWCWNVAMGSDPKSLQLRIGPIEKRSDRESFLPPKRVDHLDGQLTILWVKYSIQTICKIIYSRMQVLQKWLQEVVWKSFARGHINMI